MRTRADELYDKMVVEGESFWSAVHPLFTARDMTRDDMRTIISRGLTQTRGSYRLVLQLFNMPAEDYKAFLNFLRKHQCHMPFFKFRCLPPPAARRDDRDTPAGASLIGSVPTVNRTPSWSRCPSQGRRGQDSRLSIPRTLAAR